MLEIPEQSRYTIGLKLLLKIEEALKQAAEDIRLATDCADPVAQMEARAALLAIVLHLELQLTSGKDLATTVQTLIQRDVQSRN